MDKEDKEKEENKEIENKLPEGFLEPKIFAEKYHTNFAQRWPESKLDDIDEEDREIYSDFEILTGKSIQGKLNKFFQNGYNKGKKYNMTRKKAINSLKKFIDTKIENGEIEDQWEVIWEKSKEGDFNFFKLLKEIMIGKEEENINIKSENITFSLEPDKNAMARKNKNLKKEEGNNKE